MAQRSKVTAIIINLFWRPYTPSLHKLVGANMHEAARTAAAAATAAAPSTLWLMQYRTNFTVGYEIAPMPRDGARETVRDAFAARTIVQSAPQRAAEHHAGVAAYPRCSMCLVAFLGVCALSLCEAIISGPAQRALSLYIPCVRRPEAQVYLRACTNRPQKPQQQITIPPPAAAASSSRIRTLVPCLCLK